MKLKVVVPTTTPMHVDITVAEVARLQSESLQIDVENLVFGTASIESAYDEALNLPDILRVCQKAEAEGYDGLLIDCMGDPGVRAAREVLRIPVAGPAQTSMMYASSLAERFGVVTVIDNVLPLFHELARVYGYESRVASVRVIDLPVLALVDLETMVQRLIEQSVKAVAEDGAQAVILGCTGMLGVADRISAALCEQVGASIPVIDPVPATIEYLKSMVTLKLAQSKKAYPPPPPKDRNMLELLQAQLAPA
jgi:allantoin racemase